MDFVIDPSPIYEFMNLPAQDMAWRLIYLFGWIPIALAFLWGAKEIWLAYIRGKWSSTLKFTLLAIDIPRGNEQTPKAVENIFTYLAGAHGSFDLIEKYWVGKFQLSFSLEIVSIDGYTQFLIHTPDIFRNLVESAVYSQYPDAEITEVNDYTDGMPTRFPDDEYDVAGAEFIQANKPVYPIKIYKEFEHQMGAPETQFKDPMASLMDLYSSLRKGEQLWCQIILIPLGFDWMHIGDQEISKILGEKFSGKDNIWSRMVDKIIEWMGVLSEMIFSIWQNVEEKEKKEDDTFRMFNLKPKEKNQIEAIQDKVSKIGFEFKMRLVYMAKKEMMNKPKAINGFVGYMKQFANLELNNIKPDTKKTVTSASYFFTKRRINARKNRLVRNYIKREDWAGKRPGILNIEELASLWHFPVEAVVKAPLIQKAPGRKAEPPMALPFGEEPKEYDMEAEAGQRESDNIFASPPESIAAKSPIMPNSEDVLGSQPFPPSPLPTPRLRRTSPPLLDLRQTHEDAEPAVSGVPHRKKGAPPDNLPVA